MSTQAQPRSTLSKLRILVVLPLILALSGCIRLNMDLKVNDDSTVSGAIVFAVADELAAMGTGSTENPLGTAPLLDSKAKGVTEVPYKSGGFTGTKFVLNHTPLSAFEDSKNKEGSLSIVKSGKHIRVSGFLDLTMKDTGTGDPLGALSGDFASSMFAGADLRISITVPGKIVKSTGTISADRKMVTWRPKLGKKTNLATTVDLPSVPWTLIGGAAAFLIALLIALFVIRSQKKAKMTPLTNETPPAEEPPLLQTEPF
jgi:hypothetical protein